MKRPTTLKNAITQIDGAVIPEATAQKALSVLEDAMDAKCFVRGPDIGPEGRRYVEVPDFGIRVVAATRLLEWKLGKPTAQLTINSNPAKPGGQADAASLMRIVVQSPDLFRKIMDSYIEGAKQVTPIKAPAPEDPKQSA